MIIAWGLFILGIVFILIIVTALIRNIQRGKAFEWDLKPFILSVLMTLFSAQYIWG